MEKKVILYINSTVRKNSRTDRLARFLLSALKDEVIELKLEDEKLEPLNKETLAERDELINRKDFDSPRFRYARLFAQADIIVISAPFWDSSFPASLKVFIENIYVNGLVTKYNDDGSICGLCRAKKLYYVATAGGKFVPDYSYGYIESLCKDFFGIKETHLICAEMLDVRGSDVEKLLKEEEQRIACTL